MSPGIAVQDKRKLGRINKNFFLHIHAGKVHPHSLKPTYTFGLGIILGFLFLILIFTGLIMMMYYSPSVERAYDSVKDIVFILPGGRLIRNVHRWAAHGMVLLSFLHLIRVFYTGSYLGGRSLNWVFGVCMQVLVLFMNFSGYLLPWDQLAYWAVTIGSNIAASFREFTDILGVTSFMDIGGWIKKLFIGDELVGQAALTRFFMLHVVFLPLGLIVLTGLHLWRIRKDGGISRPEAILLPAAGPKTSEDPAVEPGNQVAARGSRKLFTWPVVMWAELALLMLTAAALLIMAFLFDAPLREQANPTFPENPAKSPWYFLGIQELVSYSAFAGGVIVPGLFLYFLFSIPYMDREDRYIGHWFSGRGGLRITWQSLLFGSLSTLLLVFVIVRYGWLRDWIPGLPQVLVMLVNPATLGVVLYVAWAQFIKMKTRSTRMTAIALFTCAMAGLILFTAIGIWFRGPNWAFYWSASQWPVL